MSDMGEKFLSLLKEMEEEDKTRRDINLPLNSLIMQDDGRLKNYTYGEFDPSPATINKLSSLYKLSPQHLQVLSDNGRPDLVAETFNHFLLNDRRTMKLRTVGDKRIKGIVHKDYQKFDDHALFTQIGDYLDKYSFDYNLEVLEKNDEFTRIRFMINDTQQNMGMTDERGLDRDILQGGFEVSNSEIGSKMGINSLIYRQVCTNGMMGIGKDDDNAEIFQKRGRNFNPFSKRTFVERGLNNTIELSVEGIERYRKTKGIKVDNPLEELAKIGGRYSLGKNHVEGMQEQYQHEKQKNMYGVLNAVTRHARRFDKDYKNRSRFEFIANDVMEKVAN